MSRTGKVLVFLLAVIGLYVGQVSAQEAQHAVVVEANWYKQIDELKYPQVTKMENTSLQTKINKDFTNYIKDSYKAYKKNKKLAKQQGFPADSQSDFEVEYNQANKLSVVTSDYKFAGGAHGSTEVQSFNYDLDEGKRVWLTDILTTEQQIEQVTEYVWQYASERPEIFYPDIEIEDIQLDKQTAFYFTDNGIALVFQQYEIAPYVAGNQEIKIPSDVYQQ